MDQLQTVLRGASSGLQRMRVGDWLGKLPPNTLRTILPQMPDQVLELALFVCTGIPHEHCRLIQAEKDYRSGQGKQPTLPMAGTESATETATETATEMAEEEASMQTIDEASQGESRVAERAAPNPATLWRFVQSVVQGTPAVGGTSAASLFGDYPATMAHPVPQSRRYPALEKMAPLWQQ